MKWFSFRLLPAAKMFSLTESEISESSQLASLKNQSCGALAQFSGWVRDHHNGRTVEKLEYEVYPELALNEGTAIVQEARKMFPVEHISAIHRTGTLQIEECAVWVGASSAHRAEAFAACRWVIDEIKSRLPIWKREYYADGAIEWAGCHACEHANSHSQIDRYARQKRLPEFGVHGQTALHEAKVLVIGAGGLGCPVLQYLAAAGVGEITIIDPDTVEQHNLHRQVLFQDSDIGRPKASSAGERLRALNPQIKINSRVQSFNAENACALFSSHTLVLECSDSRDAKNLASESAYATGKAVLIAAIERFSGELQWINPALNTACRHCLGASDFDTQSCQQSGILGPAVGVLGTLQALEAIKFLSGIKTPSDNQVTLIDLQSLNIQHFSALANPQCKHTGRSENPNPEHILRAGRERANSTIKYAQKNGWKIIDLREAEERGIQPFSLPHTWIPFSHGTEQLKKHATTDSLLLICASGKRSAIAAQQLAATGLSNFEVLAGGINALAVADTP